MKNSKFKIVAAAALLLCAFAFKSEAQFASGILTVTNVYNAPVQKAFAIQSVTTVQTAQALTMLITNISTNHTYTLNYWPMLHGQTTTNAFPLSTLTTNFSAALGFTNGGNAIVALPPVVQTVTNDLWGTFSNSAWGSGTWTNGIQVQ